MSKLAQGGSQQQWLPSLTIPTLGNLGNFDQFGGGDTTATPPKNRPGGMGPEQTYVGLPVFSDVTLTRVYEEERDHVLIGQLRALAGSTYATVSLQPLDDAGHPWGSPRTYYGRIGTINDGATDSNTAAVRKWSVMLVVETINN